MEAVGKIVVEPIVSETLVDRQADVVEPGDLHDALALVVVDGVVAGVAHHLVHLDDGLVGDVAPRHVVLVHGDLLVRASLTAFEMQGDLFHVLLEHVVVQDASEGGGRPRAAGLDEQAADVARQEVVVEEHVLRVLDVHHDGRLAGGVVAVEADAIARELVPLHGDDRVDLAGRVVVDGAPLVVVEYGEAHVVFDVAIEADDGDRERDDLGDEAKMLSCSCGMELDAHGVGSGCLIKGFLIGVMVDFDGHDGLGRVVVEVAVVQGQVVGYPGLARAVDEVVLEHAEPDRLDVVDAGEHLHAVHGVVVVLVVEQDPLLDHDLLLRIANVDQAENMVGKRDSG